jgi:hypothetical protein
LAQRLLSIHAARQLREAVAASPGWWSSALRGAYGWKRGAKCVLVTYGYGRDTYEVKLAILPRGGHVLNYMRLDSEEGKLLLETEHSVSATAFAAGLTQAAEQRISALRDERAEVDSVHCLQCGYLFGQQATCPHCGQHRDRWQG